MKVYLIGVGMGNPDTLTMGAMRAIEQSGLLIGAKRLLEPYAERACEKLALIKSDDIVQALEQATCECASVLLSGDVGFYSGATALYGKLDDFDVDVIPGISSLVYFCAKLRTPWQDATLVSAHGRNHDAVGTIQSNPKVFCITGGATKVEDICRELVGRGLGDISVSAGERLSYDDERIVRATAAELANQTFADLSVMLAENPRPIARRFAAPALADSDFLRGQAPMTKEEVRALVISKLHIEPGHVVWDVGAGTGSVSIEAALAASRGVVYAIEKNPEALELMRQNRKEQGVTNMVVIEGAAPEALSGIAAPDRVFVGGSSGNLAAIIEAAYTANSQVRLCATAVTLETLSELLACLRAHNAHDADIVQVFIARADRVGSYHLMRAENPVYIVTVDFKGLDAVKEGDA